MFVYDGSWHDYDLGISVPAASSNIRGYWDSDRSKIVIITGVVNSSTGGNIYEVNINNTSLTTVYSGTGELGHLSGRHYEFARSGGIVYVPFIRTPASGTSSIRKVGVFADKDGIALDGKNRDWGNDIRFTTDDGETLLDYWIVTGAFDDWKADVWLELAVVASGLTEFYIYYGNKLAEIGSDGDATFMHFDDFPGSAIDTGKWTPSVTGDGVITVVSGTAILDTGGSGWAYIYRDLDQINGYKLETRAKIDSTYDALNTMRTRWNNHGNVGDVGVFDHASYPTPVVFWDGFQSEQPPLDEWLRLKSTYAASGDLTNGLKWGIYQEDENETVVYYNEQTPSIKPYRVSAQVGDGGGSSSGKMIFDWFFVRQLVATEPTISGWEAEESFGPSIAEINAVLAADIDEVDTLPWNLIAEIDGIG